MLSLLYIRSDDLLSFTGAAKMTSFPRHLTLGPGDNKVKSVTLPLSLDTGLMASSLLSWERKEAKLPVDDDVALESAKVDLI